MPDLQLASPWPNVYCSCNDCAFITTIDLDTTSDKILDSGLSMFWDTTPISWNRQYLFAIKIIDRNLDLTPLHLVLTCK